MPVALFPPTFRAEFRNTEYALVLSEIKNRGFDGALDDSSSKLWVSLRRIGVRLYCRLIGTFTCFSSWISKGTGLGPDINRFSHSSFARILALSSAIESSRQDEERVRRGIPRPFMLRKLITFLFSWETVSLIFWSH